MPNLVIEGKNWDDLQLQSSAWFKPGKRLQVDIGLTRDLSIAELATIQQKLLSEGLRLLGPVEIGTGRWQNTLRIKFENPTGYAQIQALPVVVLIILAVGAVGIGGILGWRIGETFQNWFPAIAVLTLAGFLGYAYITSRGRT